MNFNRIFLHGKKLLPYTAFYSEKLFIMHLCFTCASGSVAGQSSPTPFLPFTIFIARSGANADS